MEVKAVLAGIGFLVVGLLMFVAGLRKNGRCSARTIGRITGVKEDKTTDDEGFHYYSYSPVYQYEVNGQIYSGSGGPTYKKEKKVPVGGSIPIFYNPNNPKEHQPKGGKKGLPVAGLVFMLIGAVFIAASL